MDVGELEFDCDSTTSWRGVEILIVATRRLCGCIERFASLEREVPIDCLAKGRVASVDGDAVEIRVGGTSFFAV